MSATKILIRKRDEARVKAAMLLGCLAARAGMALPDYGADALEQAACAYGYRRTVKEAIHGLRHQGQRRYHAQDRSTHCGGG